MVLMTEDRWVNNRNIEEMIDWLIGPPPMTTKRKLTLFMCGCTRMSTLWNNADDRKAISIIEDEADNGKYPDQIETKALNFARMKASIDPSPAHRVAMIRELVPNPFLHYTFAPSIHNISSGAKVIVNDATSGVTGRRIVHLSPDWCTPKVKALADAAYIFCRQTLDPMTSLGVELAAAGCRDPLILRHCQEQYLHFKGCWLLDLLLGRDTL